MNSTGIAILEEDFGLTEGVIYYEFVEAGKNRSTQPCDSTEDETINRVDQLRWSRQDCIDYGGTWLNEFPNFDNFGNALVTLFHLATTEGWVDVMHRCVSAVGKDQHPMAGFDPWRGVTFVLYIIVVAIFLTQLFATALVANFERLSQQESGIHGLTETQREWLSTTKSLATMDLRRKAQPPQNSRCRLGAFRLATAKFFKVFNHVVVVAYLCMCIVEALFPFDGELRTSMIRIQAATVLYFCTEMGIKFAAFGRKYFVRWEQSIGFQPHTVPKHVERSRSATTHKSGKGPQRILFSKTPHHPLEPADYEELEKNNEKPPRRCRCPKMRRRYVHGMNILEVLSVIFCIVSVGMDLIIDQNDGISETFKMGALVFRALRLTRIMSLLRAM